MLQYLKNYFFLGVIWISYLILFYLKKGTDFSVSNFITPLLLSILVIFKDPISLAIGRVRNIRKGDFKIDLSGSITGWKEYANDSPLIKQEKARINREILSQNIEQEQKIIALVDNLSEANRLIQLLVVEQTVTRAMIEFLYRLNRKLTLTSEEELKELFLRIANEWHEQHDYEKALKWMLEKNLISREAKSPSLYFIGLVGKEYLIFREQVGGFCKEVYSSPSKEPLNRE